MVFSTSAPGTGFTLVGVVPDRWSHFLLSDRDENNELVGTARDGIFAFGLRWVSSGLPRASTHRTNVQETVPKAILPQTTRTR